jgi:oxygen-independent coproporphyrinogen-3 oxidase
VTQPSGGTPPPPAEGAPPPPAAPAPEHGVYVHVPFCAHRCDYCAFATFTDRAHLVDAYLDALVRDVERAVAAGMPRATSVFVGGGTPTHVPADGLARVIRAIPAAPGAEITVECNPDDVTPALMETYAAAGVDRVSIGVQSTVAHVLASLGRRHGPAAVAPAVRAARAAGIARVNLDVIYGAAGETLDDWRRTLDDVVALGPSHVSAYGLTVEAGTPLALEPARHPDDDDQADKYDLADEVLVAAGLANYEISNWSRPGDECRHNLTYWRQGNYDGFGSAAHSHRDGRRWWNVRTPERYIELVAAGRAPESAGETLDDATRRLEGLQLRLRMREGVPASAFEEGELAEMDGDGLVAVRDGRATLTRPGRRLANAVALRLRA